MILYLSSIHWYGSSVIFFLVSLWVSGFPTSDLIAQATQLDQILYFQIPYRQPLPAYCLRRGIFLKWLKNKKTKTALFVVFYYFRTVANQNVVVFFGREI